MGVNICKFAITTQNQMIQNETSGVHVSVF